MSFLSTPLLSSSTSFLSLPHHPAKSLANISPAAVRLIGGLKKCWQPRHTFPHHVLARVHMFSLEEMQKIEFRKTAPNLFKEDLDNGKELWLIQAPASVSRQRKRRRRRRTHTLSFFPFLASTLARWITFLCLALLSEVAESSLFNEDSPCGNR